MAASESSLSKPYVFRGTAHVVTIGLSSGQLLVSVEERVTGNQWKGAFSATDVEDLTEKTGHYENFPDFVLLLKSAVTQSSEAVTLDLLTLADLKLLHCNRAGSQTTASSSAAATMATDASNRKRFLLLIRSVGPNSTIKYPLRLRHADPVDLLGTIRQLQEENTKLKQQKQKDYILKELETLKRDYDRLLKEKEDVENEFHEYRRETETSTKRGSSQEIQILKDFIKALEKDLADDQRIIAKRKDQYRKVLVELDEVKARERNLQVRVKSLTNELAQYKRRGSRAYPGSLNSRPVNSTNSRNSSQASSSSARNLSAGLRLHSSRDSSGLSSDRSQNRSSRSRFPDRSQSARDRSSSRESGLSLRNRRDSRERSLSKDRFRSPNTSGGSYRMKPPSPSGNRTPRFNPTAFQADKLRRQRESELKKKRQINTKLVGGDVGKSTRSSYSTRSDFSANSREFRRSRTPSIDSIHSLRSSIESLSDIPFASDVSQGQNKYSRETGSRRTADIREQQNGHELPPKTGKVRITGKVLSSTPDTSQRTRSRIHPSNKENHDATNHSTTKSREISELDERLSRIQQFLLENDIK